MISASLTLLIALNAFAQQQSVGSIQQKSGNCSPTVAGVQGNLTVQVQCPGLPAEAVKSLNKKLAELLNKGTLEKLALRREAQNWQKLYQDLTSRLADAGVASALSRKAKELLERGELGKAGEVLDEAVAGDESDIDRAAEDHYERARVYWLQFQPSKALEQYEMAYRYRPSVIAYGVEYQSLLEIENHFADTERVGIANLARVRSLPDNDPQRVKALPQILSNLGQLYMHTSRPKLAETNLSEAEQLERQLPADDLENQHSLAVTLSGLAQAHLMQDKYEMAAAEFAESVSIYEHLDKQTNRLYEPELANVLTSLGGLRFLTMDFAGAQDMLERAFRILRPSGASPGLAHALGNLALVYEERCNIDAALKLSMEVTSLLRDWARTDPDGAEPDLALSFKNLGVVYLSADKPDAADAAFTQVLSIYDHLAKKGDKVYGPKVTNAKANLGAAKLAENRNSEAEKLFKEALGEWTLKAKAELRPGDEVASVDGGIASMWSGLGDVYAKTNRPKEAELAYQESIGIYKRFSMDNVHDAIVWANTTVGLAKIYRLLNQPRMSETYYSQSSATYQKLAQSSCNLKYRSDLADALAGLAWANVELKEFDAARSNALRSAAAYEELRRLDPKFAPETYARSIIAQISVLKKADASPAAICPLAIAASKTATEVPTQQTAQSLALGCQ